MAFFIDYVCLYCLLFICFVWNMLFLKYCRNYMCAGFILGNKTLIYKTYIYVNVHFIRISLLVCKFFVHLNSSSSGFVRNFYFFYPVTLVLVAVAAVT